MEENPMTCDDDFKTLLSRHVDGDLSPSERADVEEHLADCAPCRDLFAIFQKNESLLSNALCTEAFGNAVIESVIGEIKREPAEAKPVEESAWEGFRSRPALQVAAVALVALGLVFVLSFPGDRGRLDEADRKIQKLTASQQEQERRTAAQNDEYVRLINNLRSEEALRRAPERWSLAYVEPTQPHQFVVRANFDFGTFTSFDLYRRGDDQDGYTKVNGSTRLASPEFADSKVKPGQGYVYKFRAYAGASDDNYVESFPISMRAPKAPQLAPEKSISVRCTDITVNKKLALFTLERFVNGAPVSDKFYVEPGQRVGDIREIAGVGRVDFRTNLVLEQMEEGSQTLPISITRPLLDRNGNPVLDRIDKETFVPKTVQVEEVLSTRTNLRALFRLLTPTPGQPQVDLWKGSWLQLPAQE
jgi:hypothetical protein